MTLNDVLGNDQNAMDKYAAFWSKQSQFSGGAAKISQGKYSLKRLKMQSGDALLVIPLMIHLPLTYDGNMTTNPIPYLGSYETVIKVIKTRAARDAKYADALSSILGETYAQLDLSNLETVSQTEREVFRRFRHPLVYAKTVMTVKAANSANQFGTPYAVDIATDPETGDYIDDINNPLIWNLHNLETACIASQIKELRTANEQAGDARRTEQAMSQQFKDMWNNRIISNPYSLGTTRVLFFKTDKDYVIDKQITDKWSPDDASIRDNEYYIKINKKLLERIESIIGSKFDKYDDYILLKQNTPAFDEKTRGTAAQSISRMAASSDERLDGMLKDFDTAYANYRNNLDLWDEKIIKTSAFEYRTISDKNIATIFQNSMASLASIMQTQEIIDKYNDTIAAIDMQLASDLTEAALSNSLRTVGDISAEVASAPVITENTPGYGGDEMEAEDDSAAMMAALTTDTPL